MNKNKPVDNRLVKLDWRSCFCLTTIFVVQHPSLYNPISAPEENTGDTQFFASLALFHLPCLINSTLSFQIIGRFDKSRYIGFATYLDIMYF